MKLGILLAGAAVLLLTAASVSAQEAPYLNQKVKAPANAFEITIGGGYGQGFGMLQSGVGLPDVANAGGGGEISLGYRYNPRLMVGVGGEYLELNAARGTGVRSTAFNLNATWLIDPNTRLNPWVSLGSGYRLLWETNSAPAPDIMTHGFQLARLRAGFDVQTTDGIALGPVIGADATMFLWDTPSNGNTVAIKDPRLSTFVFGGIQGRFDLGGRQEFAKPEVASK